MFPFILTRVGQQAADSFLPFILPPAYAEGPPEEISLKQKKTWTSFLVAQATGFGPLEGDSTGTHEPIPTSLSGSSRPYPRRGWALVLLPQAEVQWPMREPCKAVRMS